MRLVVVLLALAGAAACGPRAPEFAGFVDAPVAAVAAPTAGRVVSVLVREGNRVKKGQLVAQLDSSDKEALVVQAQANLERAHEAVREAEANLAATAPTVTGAGADIARAEAVRDQAEKDLARMKRLFAEQAVTRSDLDNAQSKYDQAAAALDAVIAQKASTKGRLAASAAAVADARAAEESAAAAVDVAQAQLVETKVTAPFDGIVVSRNIEPGEWAGPGTPIVTIESGSELWVRLDVGETELRGIRIAAPAVIRVIALPGERFRGHVMEIGAEGDFALNRDVKRGRPDIRTFLVRVAFDQRSPALRPGMTAEVTVQM